MSMTTTSGESCSVRRTASRPSRGFADDFNARVGLEQELKAFADYAVIVGNEYFCGGGHGDGLLRSYRQVGMILTAGIATKKCICVFCGLQEQSQRRNFFYLACCQHVTRFVILIKVVLSSLQDESPEWR